MEEILEQLNADIESLKGFSLTKEESVTIVVDGNDIDAASSSLRSMGFFIIQRYVVDILLGDEGPVKLVARRSTSAIWTKPMS
jgi:hypothetical protein